MSDPPLLSVAGLGAAYGDVPALWDVSLTVSAGRVTSLLGRNGAGKTTTLRTIAGLGKLTRGTIEFDGCSIERTPAHRRTGLGLSLVQENKRIFRGRTIEENLLLGGFSMRRRRGRRYLLARCQEMYERFPVLGERRTATADSLSGGQQQMLAIAQALMPAPRLLMLDEPSSGLAPSIVDDVLDVVDALCREGIGVLLVEQSADVALAVADDVVVLDIGRVALARPADEVDRAMIERAYLGGVGDDRSPK